MAITINATLIEDMEGAGPTFLSIGGGQGAAVNTDVFIAGSQSAGRRSDNQGSMHGFWANPGSTFDLSAAGEHTKFYAWVTHYSVLTGMEFRIGPSTTVYETHTVTVSEYPPLGGWWPIWLEVGAGVDTGSPAFTAVDEFGVTITIGNVGGNAPNNILDQIHHSTRPVMTWDGSTGDFADFVSSDATNALGTIVSINGALFLFANLQIGSSTATTFTDSGVAILAPEFSHLPTATTWQGIDIDLQHASTVITWTDSSYGASDPAGATRKPDLIVTGTAGTADLSRLALSGLRTVELTSAVTMENTTFSQCGQVDLTSEGSDGALVNGASVLLSAVAADTGAVLWNTNTDPDAHMEGMTFSKGTAAHHAIDFGTNLTTDITLRDVEFTGFGTTEDGNDAALRFLATSGSLSCNLIGCTVGGAAASSSNVKKDDAAGIAVTLVFDPVTTTVNATTATGTPIENARVYLEATNATGPLPYDDTVTITRSGSTASVSHTAHGLVTGQKIAIRGAVQREYNGVYTIANATTNAYDYTVTGTPTTPATGTIKATGVLIHGLTNASGVISDTRSLSGNQPVTGHSRKSSGSPYYKSAAIVGTVDSSDGATFTAVMLLDE